MAVKRGKITHKVRGRMCTRSHGIQLCRVASTKRVAGGAAWSCDHGLSWQAANEGRDQHYTWGLAVDPDDPECWYISANSGARLAHQNDKSAKTHIYRWRGVGPWEVLGGGLPEPLDSFPYALASNSGALFAGFGDGRIYRSLDGGEHWLQLPIHGAVPSRIVALSLLFTDILADDSRPGFFEKPV